ncbi:MAG: hypothetical protein KBD85_05485 [Elusimicrobia bacterium]|nr:hypothetical protein [Elusimicrobiota bacterium]MBP9127912.1 hypothetical protein [Elusimicrobiota bacterium]MBP9699452.1 hypothetical protein [Elusimicrobiota bacterium]
MPVETENLLFCELQLGPVRLKNRLVMAPMTRCRAGEGHFPTALLTRP